MTIKLLPAFLLGLLMANMMLAVAQPDELQANQTENLTNTIQDATEEDVRIQTRMPAEGTLDSTNTQDVVESIDQNRIRERDPRRELLFEPLVFSRGSDPDAVADAAIATWQDRANASPLITLNLSEMLETDNAQIEAQAVCEDIAVLGNSPIFISQFVVNIESRRLHEETDENNKIYSYAATVQDSSVLAQIYVHVQKEADSWQATAVRSQLNSGVIAPSFLGHPLAAWVFALFSIYFTLLLLRPSWYRRWLAQGWKLLWQHRGITLMTIVLLYGSYLMGHSAAITLPVCQQALMFIVADSFQSNGLDEVLNGANVLSAASTIFSWNFIQGTFVTTFTPALIFAIPAYLINIVRYFFLGFVLAPASIPWLEYSWHIPVAVIELMAYVLVTVGGGMLLVTVIREGIRAFSKGVHKLMLMLPLAFLLLWIGAWYEALELFVIIPFLRGL